MIQRKGFHDEYGLENERKAEYPGYEKKLHGT